MSPDDLKSGRQLRTQAAGALRHGSPRRHRRRPRPHELRRRDLQVMLEGPVDEAARADAAQRQRQQPRRHARDQVLRLEQRSELPLVRGREVAVAHQGGRHRLASLDHGAELAPAGDPEVQRRTDPLRGQRQAVPRRVAHEEDAVAGRLAQLVRDPVALVADGVPRQVLGEQHGGVLDVEARVEGTDPDAHLVGGREAPAVARRHVAAVDPDLHLVARAPGMHLEPA